MRLAWATDIHLDFVTDPNDIFHSSKNIDTFCSLILKDKPEALLLSGDISLSSFLVDHLVALEERLRFPIYFVLGNHDFWRGDFDGVRRQMKNLSYIADHLKYLSTTPYINLEPNVSLVGHDGWYDGFYGDPKRTNFIMNDWNYVSDFAKAGVMSHNSPNIEKVLLISRQQASSAAHHIANGIKAAISKSSAKKIIIATHVPPFTQPIDAGLNASEALNFYPWYASRIMGDMLLSAAKSNPHVKFEIFCGHIHSDYEGLIAPNLLLRSGKSEYSEPRCQGVYNISL